MTSSLLESIDPITVLSYSLDEFEQALQGVPFVDEEEKDGALSAYQEASKDSLEFLLQSLSIRRQGILRLIGLFNLVRPLERSLEAARPTSIPFKLFGVLQATLIAGHSICGGDSSIVISKLDCLSQRTSAIRGDEIDIVPEDIAQCLLAQLVSGVIDNCDRILRLRSSAEIHAYEPAVNEIEQACSRLEKENEKARKAVSQKEQADDLKRAADEEKIRNVQVWIEKVVGDLPDNHDGYASKRVADTGTTFVGKVQEWLGAKAVPTFLAYGPPGVGKTYLACAVISRHFEKPLQGIDGLAYIYFSYNDLDRQTALAVYAGIALQLLTKSSQLRDDIFQLFDKHKNSPTKEKSQILKGMKRAVTSLKSSILLIFDALDEASEDTRDEILDLLEGARIDSARILATSRNDYRESIGNEQVVSHHVRADPDDIRVFLEDKLDNRKTNRIVKDQFGVGTKAQKFMSEIKEELLGNSLGLFLHTEYAVKDICTQVDIKGIKNAASKQHKNANNIYAETLDRIGSLAEPEKQLAYRIIAWLTFTKKPFQEDELREAFSISNEDGRVIPDAQLVTENAVEYCHGLVIRVKMTRVSYLQLAHSTVREYFLQVGAFQHYHVDMCLTCFNRVISCLPVDIIVDEDQDSPGGTRDRVKKEFDERDDDSDESSTESSPNESSEDTDTTGSGSEEGDEDNEDGDSEDYEDDEIDNLEDTESPVMFEDGQSWRFSRDVWPQSLLPWVAKKTPFSSYAARYALSHLAEAGTSSEIEQVVFKFAQTAISRRRKSTISGKYQDHPYSMNMLHMASFIGMPSIIDKVLDMPMIHTDDKDVLGRTALMWALGLSREAVADRLLDAGTQLDVCDHRHRSTLMYATAIKNEAILSKLFEKAPKKDINASLLASCAKANNVFLLDKALSDVTVEISDIDENGRAPIHEAVINGSEAAVESLVRHRAKISAPDSNGRTPLLYASERQNIEIVEILIKAGANPDSPSHKSESPLHIAAKNVKAGLKMLKILLKANPNIFAEDEKGLVPIQSFLRSCKNQYRLEKEALAGVKLLSADPDILAHQSHDGANAIHEAVQYPHVSILKNLVSRASTSAINARKQGGETPIFDAIEGGNVPAFDYLIDLPGIDLLAVRDDKKTLLNCAYYADEITVARKLIDKEPRLIELAEHHSTPATHFAVERGNPEMLRILLEAGSDPRSRRHGRNTDLISYAACMGQMQCFDILLELKAWLTYDQSGRRVAHKDDHNKTLLHEAACGPSLALFERIMSALPLEGLSLEDCDIWGQTPLHYAAKNGRETFVIVLLRAGSEKDAMTAAGQTALNLALEFGSSDTVRTLVLSDARLGKIARSKQWKIQDYEKEDFYSKLNEVISAPIAQQDNDDGQLYKERTVNRIGTDGDAFDEWSPDIPYLETTVPLNAALPISQVIFETVSHDQACMGGTYHHSHTYFDAAIETTDKSPDDLDAKHPLRICFQMNRHADFNFRTHVNVFDSAVIHQDQERKEWMQALRPGDRIQLFAKAQYPAWRNYVQSARITIRYHEVATEEGKGGGLLGVPEKLHKLSVLEQTPGGASPSHQARVVIYHQSLHAENGILTSLRPLVRERTGVTAVILGTFYLCKKRRGKATEKTEDDSGAIIYLNDFAIDDPSIDELWVDVEYLHREGIKVLGMLRIYGDDEMAAAKGNWLGGSDDTAFEASYETLHDLVVSKGLDGFEFDLESDMPRLFENTEDTASLSNGLTRLIDKFHADFGPDFIIAVTASAEALLGIHGNGKQPGLNYYRTLERQNGRLISCYNVRIFRGNPNNQRSNDQDQMHEPQFPRTFKSWRVEDGKTGRNPAVSRLVRELSSYIRLLEDGVYPSNKLLVSILTSPHAVGESFVDHGVYIKPNILTSLLSLLQWSYSPLNFGGVAGWEYSSPSAVASRELKTAAANKRFESPWIWVRETKEVLENVFLS